MDPEYRPITKFTYADSDDNACDSVEIITHSHHISDMVDRFKEFLLACGYTPENVDGITYEEPE